MSDTLTPAVTEAADRIVHGFDEDLTPGQALDQLLNDSQLVAGAILQLAAER
jgi:hypothetical protein